MGDVTRLPKWAQEYISGLDQIIRNQETRIMELSSSFPETNVKVSGHLLYPDVTLPPGSGVEYYLGESRVQYRDMVSVRHDRNRADSLYVSASNGLLSIVPSSGNSVYLKIVGF